MHNIKSIINQSVVRILSPLVRLLLRYEVPHDEFSELAKRAYVKVAYKYFSLPGRKATYSRVSVLTGLSRKEVVRLADSQDSTELETKTHLNRARRVIRGWLDDVDFIDAQHQPRVLPLRGEPNSFDDLAMRYSGDITARAVLDEMLRVGAVEKIDKTHVRLIHQGFVPQGDDSEKLKILARHSRDLLETGLHNLTNDKSEARFQRQLIYHDLPDEIEREFKQYSAQKAMDLLIELDRWLADKKQNVTTELPKKHKRTGLGIYFFQNNDDEV